MSNFLTYFEVFNQDEQYRINVLSSLKERSVEFLFKFEIVFGNVYITFNKIKWTIFLTEGIVIINCFSVSRFLYLL